MFRPDSLITVFVIGVPYVPVSLKKQGLTCGLIVLDTLCRSLRVKHHSYNGERPLAFVGTAQSLLDLS